MVLIAASTRVCVRPLTTTFAPSAVRAAAIAKPMPAVEPDTTASFPCNPKFIVLSLAGHLGRGGAFDFGYVLRGQLDFAGAHDFFGLVSVARADDGAGDGGKAQGPGDGDGAGNGLVTRGDSFQTLDQLKIFGKARLAKFGAVLAPIIFRKLGDALASHGTGECARGHRRVDDDADAAAFAVRQDFIFNLTANQGVRRLERRDGSDFLTTLKLGSIVIGNANPADFPFFLQGSHGLPGFLEGGTVVFGGPVNLIEIDDVDPQAAQAVRTFLANGFRRVHLRDAPVLVPTHATFGEDVGTRTLPLLDRAGYY